MVPCWVVNVWDRDRSPTPDVPSNRSLSIRAAAAALTTGNAGCMVGAALAMIGKVCCTEGAARNADWPGKPSTWGTICTGPVEFQPAAPRLKSLLLTAEGALKPTSHLHGALVADDPSEPGLIITRCSPYEDRPHWYILKFD